MIDVNVMFKDIEEPTLFENMTDYEMIKGDKILYLSTDIEVEYYILMENILWFTVEYEEEVK